jgi:MFS family permease
METNAGTQRTTGRFGGIFPGWGMVVGGAVQNFFAFGIWLYGFNVLFGPMSTAMGWTATQTAGAFSMRSYEGGAEGPLIGWLLDKYGPRVVMLGAYLIGGIGLIGLAFTQDLVGFYALMFITSFGYNAGTYQTQYKGLSAWFRRRRGLAFGLLAVGGGLGGTVVAPLVAQVVVAYGWRVTVAILGGVVMFFGMTMSLFFRPGGPERYGLQLDGDTEEAATKHTAELAARAADSGVSTNSFTLRQALKTRAFWCLLIAFSLHSLGIGVITVHGVNLATGLGIPLAAAAVAFGSMSTVSLPGRLIAPWLGDRFSLQWITVGCLVLSGAGVAVLGSATDLTGIWIAVILYGLGYAATIPLNAALQAKYFGPKHYGAISGFKALLGTVLTGAGPLVAGFIYDATQSYSIFFNTLAAAYILAIILAALATQPHLQATVRESTLQPA